MLITGKNLKLLKLSQNSTLQSAILRMNKTKFKIIFIVKKNNIFLGTLSDGDIRRALAEGAKLLSKVNKFYNKNSIYISKSSKINNNTKNIQKIFFENNIFSIPVLDKKKIIGFYDIRDFLTQNNGNSMVLVMAGGFGKRLLPLTKKIPKPMLPIKGKPILQIILENLKKQNFKEVLISTYYKASVIKKYFKSGEKLKLKIDYLYEKSPLGTAGCLKLLKKSIINNYENLLIINGDILTNLNFQNIFDFHISHRSDLTIGVKNIVVSNDYGVIKGDGIVFTDIEEKPINSYNINAGIYILKTKIIKKIKFSKNLNMVDVINQIKKLNKKVTVYPILENWNDIGTIEVYKKYK